MFARLRVTAAVSALVLILAGCGAAIAPQIHNDANRMPVARTLYARKEYSLALDVLQPYVTSGTGNADIDQAVYLLGLIYLGQKEWASAQSQFERVVREYPESDSAGSASFRLAQALDGQARGPDFDQEFTLKAMNQYDQFLKGWPGHVFAPEAEKGIADCRARLAHKLWRTGDLYVKLKLYEPARQYFRSIIDEYADTPAYGDAMIGTAVADARMGRKDSALVVLRGLEKEFAGRPLAIEAARTRAKVEKWPAEGDRARRGHRTVETETPPPVQPQSPGTNFAP